MLTKQNNMADFKQLELFPGFGSKTIETGYVKSETNGIFTPTNRFSMSLCEDVNFTSNYQMPIVAGCTIDVPKDIYCFYRMGNHSISGVIPHFYTTDNRLLPFLGDPYGHLDMISHHSILIGIDISIKPEMPMPMKIAVSFYNKLMMAWWQYNGKTVIPNVVIDPAIINICLDGYPKHSVIAMNSSGIGKDERAKQNWQIIYPHVIDVLEPMLIIRYGGKQPNEREDISVYYDNDNSKFNNYGW